MSKLCVLKLPVGWERVSSTENEMVLVFPGRDSSIYAKVRLVDFIGNAKEIEEEMKRKAAILDAIDSWHASFLYNHIKWNADYYVCDGDDRFRAFFYAVLDGCYLIFEMVTNSTVMRTVFCHEVKRLILFVDYSVIEHDNQFELNSKLFRLKTPSSFRFSTLSTENRLFFLGEAKYLVVNIEIGASSLAGHVEGLISCNYLGTVGSTLEIDGIGENKGVSWAKYRVMDSGDCIGAGTYLMQEAQGERIISYLFERGSSTTDISSLLEFGGAECEK